jgi:hypothetical protein
MIYLTFYAYNYKVSTFLYNNATMRNLTKKKKNFLFPFLQETYLEMVLFFYIYIYVEDGSWGYKVLSEDIQENEGEKIKSLRT